MSKDALANHLAQLEVHDEGDQRAAEARVAAKSLDEKLAEAAERLIQLGKGTSSPDTIEFLKKKFPTLENAELYRLFCAAFGELGPDLAAAWEHLHDLPYEFFPHQSAFRAPSLPCANLERRVMWLCEVAQLLYQFPCGLVTPEWLAVHASEFRKQTASELMASMFGASLDGVREQDAVGRLLGSVIASGSSSAENVFDTLKLITEGKHPLGVEDSYVYRALWRCRESRAEDLLISCLDRGAENDAGASRVASIVNASAEAGPPSMMTCLSHVIAKGFLAQKEVAAVIGRWIGGFPLEDSDLGARLEMTEALLSTMRNRDLQSSLEDASNSEVAGQDAYLRLYVQAFHDVAGVPNVALQLADRIDPNESFVMAQALSRIRLPASVTGMGRLWLELLDSDNMATVGIMIFSNSEPPADVEPSELVEVVRRVFARLDEHLGLLIDGNEETSGTAAQEKLASFLSRAVHLLPTEELLYYLPHVAGKSRDTREAFEQQLASRNITSVEERKLLLDSIQQEPSLTSLLLPMIVRHGLSREDLNWFGQYLLAKEYSYRNLAMKTLLVAPTADRRAIVGELLHDSKKRVRLVGIQILEHWHKEEQDVEWGAEQVLAFSERAKITKDEKLRVDALRKQLPVELRTKASSVSHGAARVVAAEVAASPLPQLVTRALPVDFELVDQYLHSLLELYEEHLEDRVVISDHFSTTVEALSRVRLHRQVTKRVGVKEEVNEEFPCGEIWSNWYGQPKLAHFRNADIAAKIYLQREMWTNWHGDGEEVFRRRMTFDWVGASETGFESEHVGNLLVINSWLARKHPAESGAQFLLDAYENLLASIPDDYWQQFADPQWNQCRLRYHVPGAHLNKWHQMIHSYCLGFANAIPQAVTERFWNLACYGDRPLQGAVSADIPRFPPTMRLASQAFGAGCCSEEDLFEIWRLSEQEAEQLENATNVDARWRYAKAAGDRQDQYQACLDQFVADASDDLLSEDKTARERAIPLARRIRSVRGTRLVLRLLKASGKKKLVRWNPRKENDVVRFAAVVSQLLLYSMPSPGETFEQFQSAVQEALAKGWLSESRLLELGLLANQWAGWIEKATKLDGVQDAMEWLVAHSEVDTRRTPLHFVKNNLKETPLVFPDDREIDDEDDRSWAGRTTDENHSMHDGAPWSVDAAWYANAFGSLSRRVGDQLLDCLHVIATPKQAERLRHLASALKGTIDREGLQVRIEEEPGLDDVQLLALIPVAEGEQRESDLAERMRIIQSHRRAAQRLKPRKRESVILANKQARILLAQRAGIGDPDRLDWYAMSDIRRRIDAASPITVEEVKLELLVQANSEPFIRVEKKGKSQKSIPAAVSKLPKVKQLKGLLKSLKAEAKQIRKCFEEAMVTGATFDVQEIEKFIDNPLIGPPLRSLLLTSGNTVGLPAMDGEQLVLCDRNDQPIAVNPSSKLRIAHVADLFAAGTLADWRDFFADRVQAIEQSHRDFFQPSQEEQQSGSQTVSRFVDYSMREDQCLAMFRNMGWQSARYASPVSFERSVGDSELSAVVDLDWATGTVDQTNVTAIWFYDAKGGPLKLARVESRFFSEIVRQVNQIVTTASTQKEML